MRAAIEALVNARVARRRQTIVAAVQAAGIGEVRIEGEGVRLSGVGLVRRWMADLRLREAGRGRL